jgi:phosphate acetyltransferase
MALNRSTLFPDLQVGQSGRLAHTLTAPDLDVGARVPGQLMFNLLTGRFPGPGAEILAEEYRYDGTAAVGDQLEATANVRALDADTATATFDCRVVNQRGDVLLDGSARVRPSKDSRQADDDGRGALFPREGHVFPGLLQKCGGLPPVVTAVVHPCDRDSLVGPIQAAARGLIVPILVGPREKIRAAADAAAVDIASFEIVDVRHSHAAAEQGAALVRAGRASAVMKGSLHTDEFMGALFSSATGIRTDRRVSHIFVMDVPAYPRPLLITDAAINISPDLETKRDIVQNAIDLAQIIGIASPKVAMLSAVETVTPKIPSTLDAAALCKMADRGQIRGGVLDGPLAFDNAVSLLAAEIKGIVSPVAGRADILVAPDMEAGNMIAKQLTYLAGADIAGIVIGLRVPVALTSRADNTQARLASCALLSLVAAAGTQWQKHRLPE